MPHSESRTCRETLWINYCNFALTIAPLESLRMHFRCFGDRKAHFRNLEGSTGRVQDDLTALGELPHDAFHHCNSLLLRTEHVVSARSRSIGMNRCRNHFVWAETRDLREMFFVRRISSVEAFCPQVIYTVHCIRYIQPVMPEVYFALRHQCLLGTNSAMVGVVKPRRPRIGEGNRLHLTHRVLDVKTIPELCGYGT